ncbi:hypothetical protein CONCODRAFT_7054 [Conidiobolus coronatus NRRL 28638]|uniref:Uncharacterized protein n=1 Tax=Conidiobolus coronatus (strain ATCC 28846 / CBS 209.66 / NRRL 28638) TaxID=796925 RepID=A0A137P5T5_CONC2|nr:hypothetical protein CONCODRAFT_7054 [Conidiobolus coronatus NRRL 28638]|eukprot:KXN70365.1 hypothetical protein CONCODRAFT_7054 [Conidiobolus coronatus NRRL 28638]
MKLFLLTLITSTLCHKATIWERDGSEKNIQGDFGQCIYVKGTAVGIRVPRGVEVQFYKGNACQKNWFLHAWGTVKFDKAYDYYSVRLAPRGENNKNVMEASSGGFDVTNDD